MITMEIIEFTFSLIWLASLWVDQLLERTIPIYRVKIFKRAVLFFLGILLIEQVFHYSILLIGNIIQLLASLISLIDIETPGTSHRSTSQCPQFGENELSELLKNNSGQIQELLAGINKLEAMWDQMNRELSKSEFAEVLQTNTRRVDWLAERTYRLEKTCDLMNTLAMYLIAFIFIQICITIVKKLCNYLKASKISSSTQTTQKLADFPPCVLCSKAARSCIFEP